LAQHQRENHHHDLKLSELMDTLMIKIIVMQMQSIIVICNLLWTGVQTTRMQEHGLRHILLLKKSELTNYLHPLYFSASKRVDMLVPTSFTLPQLQDCIEARLGVSQTQQRIAVHGVAFHGNGSEGSSSRDREDFEERRATLMKRQAKTDVADLDDNDAAELKFYQAFFQRDDAVQSVEQLRLLRVSLSDRRHLHSLEDEERLKWIADILKPHDAEAEQHDADGEEPRDNEEQTRRGFPRLVEDDQYYHQPARTPQSDSAAWVLAQKGPSLLAVANYAKPGGDRGKLSPTKSRRNLEYKPGLALEEEDNPSGYAKYQVLIRDGQEIQVTSDEMRPDDKRLLARWLTINKAVAEGPKTSASVLVIGQETGSLGSLGLGPPVVDHSRLTPPTSGEQAASSVGGASRSETGSYTGSRQHDSSFEGLTGYPETTFEQWAQVDTMRHMIDSLVMIMEEERLPVAHLKTIEDTRPTIRLPFYGPYPLTTALFASVTTVLLGAVSTSVTVMMAKFN